MAGDEDDGGEPGTTTRRPLDAAPRGQAPQTSRPNQPRRLFTPSAALAAPPPAPDAPRKRDRWLWIWPVVVIAAMAAFGQWLGPFGALLAGAGISGVLVLYIGAGVFPRPVHLAVAVAVCLVLIGVYLSYSLGFLSGRPVGSTSTPDIGELRDKAARGLVINVDGQVLRDVQLDGWQARGASMRGAVLEGAKLAGADLRGVNLRAARLRGADLRGADLAGADLGGADLSGACLRGANLAGAVLDKATVADAAIDAVVVSEEQIRQAASWPSTPPAAVTACSR